MIVTWFCRASVAIETENQKILFDPYIPESQFDPSVYEDFPLILLTNENPVCLKAIPLLMKGQTDVYCTGGAAVELLKMGVDGDFIHIMEPGNVKEFGSITVRTLEGPVYADFVSENSGLSGGFSNLLRHFRRESIRKTSVYLVETEEKSVMILPGQTLPDNKIYPMNPDLMILPYCGNQNDVIELFKRIKPGKVLLHSWDAKDPADIKTDTKALKLLMKQECPDIAVAKPLRTRSYAL